MKIHVDAPPKRRHMVFRGKSFTRVKIPIHDCCVEGGSVLADITRDNKEWWVTKEEWQANSNVLLEKCPVAQ